MPAYAGLDLASLVDQVRSYVAEPSEGFLTRTEVVRWLNTAQMDFQSKTHYLTTSATTATVAFQQIYGLPDDYQRMQAVFYDGGRIDVVNDDEVIALAGKGNITSPGTPKAYFLRGTAVKEVCLHLWPVPDTAGKTLLLWYEQKPNELIEDTDTSMFGSEWHEALVLFAAARGKQKMRQIREAAQYRDQYQDYVNEAFVRRQRLHSDIPIAQNRFGIYRQDVDLDLLNGRI